MYFRGRCNALFSIYQNRIKTPQTGKIPENVVEFYSGEELWVKLQESLVVFVLLRYSTVRCDTIRYNTIHTSYAMLSSGIPWNMPRVTCIYTEKIQVTSGMFHGISRESIA